MIVPRIKRLSPAVADAVAEKGGTAFEDLQKVSVFEFTTFQHTKFMEGSDVSVVKVSGVPFDLTSFFHSVFTPSSFVSIAVVAQLVPLFLYGRFGIWIGSEFGLLDGSLDCR